MDVGGMGMECMEFWAYHCCSGVVGTSGQWKADSTVDTSLGVSVAQEWRDETVRWVLGYFWLPLDVGTLELEAFGGGELLGIAIPTFLPLVFLLYLACTFLCNDDIESDHAHNKHNRGGEGDRECNVNK